MLTQTTAAKPVFCLVDPNLRDFVGHHYEYDRAVIEGAEAEGYEVVTLAHRDVTDQVKHRLTVRPCFLCDIWTVPAGAGDDHHAREAAANDQFYSDLRAATANLILDRDAIVFGHMVTSRQLHGWARFARDHAATDGPTIVLLLRYQPEFYMGRTSEAAFALLETVGASGRIRLSSDSSRLAGQLQRLTTLPVATWPLPHTTEFNSVTPTRIERGRPLRVVSLGNARDEKGIIELLNAVRILDAIGQSGRFEFVFQVNDATPDVQLAIQAFAGEDHPGVTLLTEALSPDAYFDLLKAADIVALPYWREVYEARTSGIFLEAVACGKPVVCTADTWMSDQLVFAGAGLLVKNRNDNDLAATMLQMARDYERLYAEAQRSRGRWLEIHNPTSFMRALHGRLPPTSVASRPTVAVLYPWGDALQNAAGAALRVNLFMRFLAERTSHVRLLQDADHAPAVRDGIVFEAAPVAETMRRRLDFKILSLFARYMFGARNGEEFYFLLMLLTKFDERLFKHINALVKASDLVFLEYPFWAPLVERACKLNGKTFVLTSYDVICDQVRTSKPLRWLTRRLEKDALRRTSALVAVTEADQKTFRDWGLKSVVSSNCVDADEASYRLPERTIDLLIELCRLPPNIDHLFFFVGSKFLPNELAAFDVRRIAESFGREYPGLKAHFVVVGACSDPVRESNFTALGRVDDLTLKLFYENCTAVLIPLTLGTGLSLKTVEALAAGVVIVGSTVAFRGIPSDDGEGWIEENDVERYPAILARLIEDEGYRQQVSRKAAVRGAQLDFRKAFAPYLELVPELANVSPVDSRPLKARGDLPLEAARAALKLGKADLALRLVTALLAEQPNTGAAYSLRAEARLNLGQPDAALEDLDLALFHRDAVVPCLRAKARTLRRLGRGEEADRTFAAATLIALNGMWLPATELQLRASLWEELQAGEHEWIQAITAGALARRGDNLVLDYPYLFAHSTFEIGGDLEAALTAASRAQEQGFDRYWSLMLIGGLARKLERHGDATRAFRQAAEVAGSDERKAAAYNRAVPHLWSAFDQGDYEGTLNQAAQILSHWPDHPAANYLSAECQRILGCDLLVACARYRSAIESGFRSCYAQASLAQLTLALGDAKEGLSLLVQAAEKGQTADERAYVQHKIRELSSAALADLGSDQIAEVLSDLPAWASYSRVLADKPYASPVALRAESLVGFLELEFAKLVCTIGMKSTGTALWNRAKARRAERDRVLPHTVLSS